MSCQTKYFVGFLATLLKLRRHKGRISDIHQTYLHK